MHLTLTNQMWDVAAEVVLGRVLDQWLVHSSKDEQVGCVRPEIFIH